MSSAADAKLSADEGFVVIAVESGMAVRTVELCAKGSSGCVTVGPFESPDDVRVLAVRSGWLCFHRIITEGARGGRVVDPIEPVAPPCFDVEHGQLNYPGHLQIAFTSDARLMSDLRLGFAARDDIDEVLARAHPGVDFPRVGASPQR